MDIYFFSDHGGFRYNNKRRRTLTNFFRSMATHSECLLQASELDQSFIIHIADIHWSLIGECKLILIKIFKKQVLE